MKTLTATALVLLLVGAAFAQEEIDRDFPDRIKFIDDEGEIHTLDKIKIVSATYQTVSYEMRGGRKAEKPGTRVATILWGDAPKVYADGLSNLARGAYDQAISDFDGAKNAVDAGLAREWLLEYASAMKAKALRMKGRDHALDAIAEYKKALELNPSSHLYAQILIGMARCYVMLEKWSDAEATAQKLVQAGEGVKNALWQARGLWILAESKLAGNRHGEAVNAFQDIVLFCRREVQYAKAAKEKKELQTIETEAAVEQGWVRVAKADGSGQQSDWDDARRYFEGLPAEYPTDAEHPENSWVAAAVLNGAGRCLLEAAPREALLKFIEAEVTHFTSRKEVARALFLKAKAYKKLPGSRNQKMAEEALKELRTFYPDSEWAR